MKPLEFRVYDRDLKKMRYLNTSHDFMCFDESGKGYYHNMQTGLGEWFSDLMQYTCHKDVNGTKIFECDIVGQLDYKGELREKDFGVVVWNDSNCSYQIKGHISSSTMKWTSHSMKVLGNIYENPEYIDEKIKKLLDNLEIEVK